MPITAAKPRIGRPGVSIPAFHGDTAMNRLLARCLSLIFLLPLRAFSQ